MLHAADSTGTDLVSLAQIVGGLGAPALLVIGIIALAKPFVVPVSRLRELQAQIAQDRLDGIAALAAKDAALARKDEQIQTLQAGLAQEVIPALTRATDVIKAYQTQVVVPKAGP